MELIRVILESPFAGTGDTHDDKVMNRHLNREYLNAAMRDCLKRGEAPFASHRMYTDCLNDTITEERDRGIMAGFAWRTAAARTVVYQDRGISPGMRRGIDHSVKVGIPVEYRTIEGWWG